jgi:uncharacterized protein
MSANNELEQAQAVADYLSKHPEFFADYGAVLAKITIPTAHSGRAISLHERQLEVLREKNRALEMRLADMFRHGQENDAIVEKMQRWTRQLLLQTDDAQLPGLVESGMSEIFSVPQVALRLWGVEQAFIELPCAEPADDELIEHTHSLQRPYCGDSKDQAASQWLAAAGADTRSIALLPLRKGIDPKSFGLLVLGSADADRFRAGMGTAFLERIAETASASLSRLISAAP